MKLLLFFLSFQCFSIFCAGVVITSDTNTAVMLLLDNGTKRSDFVLRTKPYETDAIFAGFSSIQWMSKDGSIYKADISIRGIEGWRAIKITDSTLYIAGNLLNKPKGRFQGVLVHQAK